MIALRSFSDVDVGMGSLCERSKTRTRNDYQILTSIARSESQTHQLCLPVTSPQRRGRKRGKVLTRTTEEPHESHSQPDFQNCPWFVLRSQFLFHAGPGLLAVPCTILLVTVKVWPFYSLCGLGWKGKNLPILFVFQLFAFHQGQGPDVLTFSHMSKHSDGVARVAKKALSPLRRSTRQRTPYLCVPKPRSLFSFADPIVTRTRRCLLPSSQPQHLSMEIDSPCSDHQRR